MITDLTLEATFKKKIAANQENGIFYKSLIARNIWMWKCILYTDINLDFKQTRAKPGAALQTLS